MSEEEKERRKWRKYGQSVVNDVRDLLGPKVANHKDLFISCVDTRVKHKLLMLYSLHSTKNYPLKKGIMRMFPVK